MAKVIEIEASYILNDNYDIYEKISKYGFEFSEEIEEEDTYYTDKEETFIEDRICLRTRKTDNKLLELTYKPKTDNKTEIYGKKEVNICIDVKDYEDIKYILKELGYLEYVSFIKQRKIYSKMIDNVKYSVMIDNIVGVGKYIELEILINADDNKDKYKTKLDDFIKDFECEKLGPKNKPYRDIVKESINNKINN